jgi:6-phospho-3-hexuloisomerase
VHWLQTNSGQILREMRETLGSVDEGEADRLVESVMSCEKIFAVAVGRVMFSMQAFVKRLNHLGLPAWEVGATNEPPIGPADLLVVASGSGESVVPLAIARIAKLHGARVAHIGSNPESSMKTYADVFVRVPAPTRLSLPGEIPSRQIMTSLFEQCVLVLGDAVCLRIAELRGSRTRSRSKADTPISNERGTA